MRMYRKLACAYLRSRMQYRGSFVMSVARNLLGSLQDLVRLLLLGVSFGAMGRWSGAQIAVLYGIVTLSFALAGTVCAGFFSFSQMIRSGDFDRLLLRPCSLVVQILGSKLDLTRAGRLSTGLIGLIWGIAHLDTAFGAVQRTLLAVCIFSGVMLFGGILMMQAAACFWTIEGLEVFNTLTYGGVAMASYPLEVYQDGLKQFFLYVVPLGCLNYLPCAVLFGMQLPYPLFTAWMAPAAGGAFLLMGYAVWRVGVRRYRSAGA